MSFRPPNDPSEIDNPHIAWPEPKRHVRRIRLVFPIIFLLVFLTAAITTVITRTPLEWWIAALVFGMLAFDEVRYIWQIRHDRDELA